jgi:hypothetical protein
MSAAGKRHLSLIHELMCVICARRHERLRYCREAHHLEFDRDEHSDFAVVPLCKECHDLLHGMRRRAFYKFYRVDDIKLLAWTMQQIMETKR